MNPADDTWSTELRDLAAALFSSDDQPDPDDDQPDPAAASNVVPREGGNPSGSDNTDRDAREATRALFS